MLDILKEKILSWSIEHANVFHNNVVRDSREGKYMWEHTPDGIFLKRNGSSHFIGFNGVIYKLTDQFENHDFIMHQRLVDACSKVNVRIDIPLEYKFIEFGSHKNITQSKLLYTVVKRPNNELGQDYLTDILEGKVDTDYILDYIEQTNQIISVVKSLLQYSKGLAPCCRFTVFHRNHDSLGYFWYDIKKWLMPYNEFLDMHFDDLRIILGYLKLHNIIVDEDKIKQLVDRTWAQNY